MLVMDMMYACLLLINYEAMNKLVRRTGREGRGKGEGGGGEGEEGEGGKGEGGGGNGRGRGGRERGGRRREWEADGANGAMCKQRGKETEVRAKKWKRKVGGGG